jgi:hypothetical protein
VGHPTNNTYEIAREYAKAGIFVYPVYVKRKPDGKKDVRPIGPWRQGSSKSLADIGAWEQEHPDAGLLIDCGKSKIVVVDCDGQEGIANWLALGPPMPLGIVETAGGGQHRFYRAHPDHPIGNDQDGKVAPSVDIRGLGGFVIAPPTTDGRGAWRWALGPDWAADAPTPAVVIERMTTRPPAAAPAAAADDDFDNAAKQFTAEQAKAFVQQAYTKLRETERGFNGAINNFAMACAHFPWLVDREHCGRLVIKALGKSQGWTAPDFDDERTIDSAYSATEAGKSWVAEKVEVTEVRVPQSDPASRRLLIHSAAEMAYWLQENAGRGRMAGFFLRNGEMVHTPRINEIGYVPAPEGGKNGPAEIRAVAAPVLAAKLQYTYECYKIVDVKDGDGKKTGEKAEVPALFPVEAAKRAVDAPEALGALRPLEGLTGTPMVRADGSLLNEPGYDPESGYLYLPEWGVNVPPVPTRPDAAQLGEARDLLLHMISDFPFAGDDDRANYLGLLLTPLLRAVAPPSYKMFGIGAHQPGSGKSLLAEIAGDIHGSVLRSEIPEDEPEWRKESFAILSTTSAPVIVLDNVTGIVKSSTLAGILTAGREITSRELGKNTSNLTVSNDRVWVLTGNNLSLGGDLVRRTVTILIDPDRPNPEQRTDFAIPDLRAWVAENRNRILRALLILIRAWVAEGMPEPARKQSDSFAKWERVVAGVLQVAGIPGEFDAESGKRAAAGGDDDGLARVLDLLRDRFGDVSWSVADALEPKDDGGFLIESRDWLPGPVVEKLGRSEAAGRISLGWWLRNRLGRWVTVENRALVIREAPMEKKVARWRIEARDL